MRSPEFPAPGESGEVFNEMLATGAVVVGRRTFELAGRWTGDHHGVPIFVPTRGEPPEPPSDLVHLIPVLLGEGRRLFEHLGAYHIELELTRVIDAPGVTHLRYRVRRPSAEQPPR